MHRFLKPIILLEVSDHARYGIVDNKMSCCPVPRPFWILLDFLRGRCLDHLEGTDQRLP
jgi:hypothetical protein